MEKGLTNAQHIDLWPTRIWRFDLSHLKAHFTEWERQIEKMRLDNPEPQGRSNRCGWNSPSTLFSLEAFQPLRQACTDAFSHALRQMQYPANLKFALEAWANVHDFCGHNILHAHEKMLLSGVFYLRVPEHSGHIAFTDPRTGNRFSGLHGAGINNLS